MTTSSNTTEHLEKKNKHVGLFFGALVDLNRQASNLIYIHRK
jgi:hypothetical protein